MMPKRTWATGNAQLTLRGCFLLVLLGIYVTFGSMVIITVMGLSQDSKSKAHSWTGSWLAHPLCCLIVKKGRQCQLCCKNLQNTCWCSGAQSKESREAQPQALLDQKNREKGAESETRRKNRREQEKNGTTWHNSEETLFKRFKSSELPCPSLLHIPTGHLLRNSDGWTLQSAGHYTGTTYKCLPVAETFL